LLRYGGLPADVASDLVAGTWAHLPRPAQQAAAHWLIGAGSEAVPESMRTTVGQVAASSSGRANTADEVFALIPGAGVGIGAFRTGMAHALAGRASPEVVSAMGRYAMTGSGSRELPRILQVGGQRLTALERAQYMEIQRGIAQLLQTNRTLGFEFRNQLNTWMRAPV
jgi:hypothetical protein